MNIVVLAGGLSVERDVSLLSSTKVCNALRRKGHHAIVIDAYLGCPESKEMVRNIFSIDPGEELPNPEIKNEAPDLNKIKASRQEQSDSFLGPNVVTICQMADIVYLGLHGDMGENGQIQAAFDVLGIKYTGSGYLGSAIAMHKGYTKQVFMQANIPTAPGTVLHKSKKNTALTELGLTLPVVVKPCCGGSSVGVSIVHTDQEYLAALDESFRYEDVVVIEAYIKGREFSIGMLGSEVLPLIEIIPRQGFYDYVNKYQAGNTEEICPADLDEETTKRMQACTAKVFQVLNLEVYGRADFILDENGNFYCLEANTLPGMTPTSLIPQEAAAKGINYEDLCERVIELSLAKES